MYYNELTINSLTRKEIKLLSTALLFNKNKIIKLKSIGDKSDYLDIVTMYLLNKHFKNKHKYVGTSPV